MAGEPSAASSVAPHSIGAEQAVIGALLLSKGVHEAFFVEESLRPEDFYLGRHRVILEAMAEMFAAGDPIDVLTVTEHLRSRGRLEDAGGGQVEIDALTAAVPAAGNLRQYAKIVRDRAQQRRVVAAGYAAIANPADPAAVEGLLAAAAANGAGPADGPDGFVTLADFLAVKRPPLQPYVATADGRTVLLARGTTFEVAGPSGVGKSLAAAWDLGGRLAADDPSDWLGLRVCGGLRVLLLSLEGSDEDTADRGEALVPLDARKQRFIVWDRWNGPSAPAADDAGLQHLAAALRRHEADVLIIDTGSTFFGSGFDVDVAGGEAAHTFLERLRALSGRPLAVIVPAHTRKRPRNGSGHVYELEEVSGTFPRKADAVVVIRRVSDDESDPHRRVAFAKVRRGRQLRAKIAKFPDDGDAPERLELVGDAGRPAKSGTEAEAMSEWIEGHDEPVAAAVLRARFGISDTTLRRRASDLGDLGIERHRVPGAGNAYGYGHAEQWARLLGVRAVDDGRESA